MSIKHTIVVMSPIHTQHVLVLNFGMMMPMPIVDMGVSHQPAVGGCVSRIWWQPSPCRLVTPDPRPQSPLFHLTLCQACAPYKWLEGSAGCPCRRPMAAPQPPPPPTGRIRASSFPGASFELYQSHSPLHQLQSMKCTTSTFT